MFIMATTTYPPDKAVEVVNILRKSVGNPLPPFVKRLHMFGATSVEYGIKGYAIYEVDRGKEYEGLKEINRRMAQLFSIEGFRGQVESVQTMEEFMPILGIQIP